MVFGMRPGDHQRVIADQFDSVGVQVLVGHDVERKTLLLQPVGQMAVGREVAQPRPARIGKREVARPHGEHRPAARRQRDPRPVRMAIVGGEAEVADLIRIVGARPPRRRPGLERRIPVAARMVRIGEVGEGRGQVDDLRPASPPRVRQHKERDVVGAEAIVDAERVDAARKILGNGQLKALAPADVADVIAVEMHGAVLFRRVPPSHLAAAPVRSLHGPRRKVHERAVKRARAAVRKSLRRHIGREIPRCERAVRCNPEGAKAFDQIG